MSIAESVDRFFRVTERGSTIRTEIKGALLIFFSMSYIMIVNPIMMADAGMDQSAAFTATVIISIFGCILMGLYANFPVAQAPAMGINAFFVYTVVLMMGYTWAEALAGVFLSGIVFFLITVSGVRQKVLDTIPPGFRYGVAAGIGCFIAFIGLSNAGVIVSNPSTLVSLGDLSDAGVLLAMLCVAVTLFLNFRKIPGSIFIGMILTAIIGMVIGVIAIPSSIFSIPVIPDFTAFLAGFNPDILNFKFLVVVISFVFVQFFDSTGTLMAVGQRAGITDENGNVVCDKALMADASTSIVSGVVGCTPASSFAESAVGIEAGSRTGLTAVVVACLFAIALFIGPVFQVIDYRCTVAAMVLVGAAMITELRSVDWKDAPLTISILMTILFMLLCFSITDGIAFGLITYCICMLGAGRGREVGWIIYALAIVFVLYFAVTAIEL